MARFLYQGTTKQEECRPEEDNLVRSLIEARLGYHW